MENKFDKLVPINYLSFQNPREWAGKGRIALYEELGELYKNNGEQPFLLNINELSKKLGIPKRIINKLLRWYASDIYLQIIKQTIFYKGKSSTETYIGFSYIDLVVDTNHKVVDSLSHGAEIKPMRVREKRLSDDECGLSIYRFGYLSKADL